MRCGKCDKNVFLARDIYECLSKPPTNLEEERKMLVKLVFMAQALRWNESKAGKGKKSWFFSGEGLSGETLTKAEKRRSCSGDATRSIDVVHLNRAIFC